MARTCLALVAMIAALAGAALAVEPDEQLDDPALEARARAVSQHLRCVVCQSQSIDESNATLARDMRLLVRERILEGDSDQEVLDYVVDRYGDYVLLAPPVRGRTILLWAAPLIFLVLGGVVVVMVVRQASRAVDDEPSEPETVA